LQDKFYQSSNLNEKKRIFMETSFKEKVIDINTLRQKLLETKENIFNTDTNDGSEKKKRLGRSKMSINERSKPKTAKPPKGKDYGDFINKFANKNKRDTKCNNTN